MKTINFLIFFSIFFLLYGLVNYYIFIRGWQSLPANSRLKTSYMTCFIILALAFFIGRILERFWLCPVSEAFVWIGSFWLAAMVYFFLLVILFDVLRFVNHWFPFFHLITHNMEKAKLFALLTSISIVILILIAGHINAITPRVKTLNLTIPSDKNNSTLNIVAASDIHLGTIIGRKRFCKIVDKINTLNPDLVLFPGDIVDEDLAPVIKENLGDALERIKSKFGVYAITGNHEYIGGVEAASRYLQKHHVIMLRDSVVKINNSVYIIGREDRMINRFANKQRKSLTELMQQVDDNYPTILMDHQPFGLHEAAENGIDLQLSGHTHHGQLWPFNYITKAIYELSWGYKKNSDTHLYVSCGVGTWGPPVRTGNRPEIVNIILNLK